MTIPAKPINELEKKTWITDQDLILIVDASTGEARVADKEELRGIGIENIKKSKSGKTTTLTINTTDGQNYKVQLEDGGDGYTPEFKLEGTVFKWKFPNESQWTTLFDITSFKGEEGNDGVWISEITHTKRGKTTTITIKKTDGSSHPFNIEDGEKGNDGKNPEFQLWATHLQWRLQGENEWKDLIPKEQIRGATITNIAKTAGNSLPWTTDTYTISLSDGQAFNFFVYHGRDGSGSGDMLKSANLSDLADKNVARTNLSVYSKSEVNTKLWVKQNTAEKNQANGYAGLDNNKKLDPSVIPVIATTETVVVANKTTRLALTTAQVQRGDYAIQTDSGEKFILSGNNPQQEGHRTLVADTTPDWSQIDNKPSAFTPATHTHTKEQVGLGKVDNTSDAEKNSAVATLTNKTINGDNNTITKVNSLKNLKDNSELKLWAGNTADIPAPEAQQAGVIYFGFKQ